MKLLLPYYLACKRASAHTSSVWQHQLHNAGDIVHLMKDSIWIHFPVLSSGSRETLSTFLWSWCADLLNRAFLFRLFSHCFHFPRPISPHSHLAGGCPPSCHGLKSLEATKGKGSCDSCGTTEFRQTCTATKEVLLKIIQNHHSPFRKPWESHIHGVWWQDLRELLSYRQIDRAIRRWFEACCYTCGCQKSRWITHWDINHRKRWITNGYPSWIVQPIDTNGYLSAEVWSIISRLSWLVCFWIFRNTCRIQAMWIILCTLSVQWLANDPLTSRSWQEVFRHIHLA